MPFMKFPRSIWAMSLTYEEWVIWAGRSSKMALKGEIAEEAWESLKLTVSHPFAWPKSGRISVEAFNHLGDEVMKLFGVN